MPSKPRRLGTDPNLGVGYNAPGGARGFRPRRVTEPRTDAERRAISDGQKRRWQRRRKADTAKTDALVAAIAAAAESAVLLAESANPNDAKRLLPLIQAAVDHLDIAVVFNDKSDAAEVVVLPNLENALDVLREAAEPPAQDFLRSGTVGTDYGIKLSKAKPKKEDTTTTKHEPATLPEPTSAMPLPIGSSFCTCKITGREACPVHAEPRVETRLTSRMTLVDEPERAALAQGVRDAEAALSEARRRLDAHDRG